MRARKMIEFLCVLVLLAGLCACGGDGNNNSVAPTETPTPTSEPTPTEVPATPTPTPNPLDSLTIKDFYKDDFKIGVALPNALIGNVNLTPEIVANFNSLTLENESKPSSLLDIPASQKGLPDTYTEPKVKFDSLVKGFEFAKANGMTVRFHTLLWHEQTPRSFFTEDYTQDGKFVSRDVMLKRMESYIRQVVTYVSETYPGLVYCYDVVNEAVNPGDGDPNGMRVKTSLWYQVVGADFMEYAFAYARKYAPEGVDLYYNDFNCYVKKDKILACLEPIRVAGNIDGIGMQCHIDTHTSVARAVKGTAQEFTKAGYKVQITELDIGTSNSENGFEAQAMKYKVLFTQIQKAKQEGTVNIDSITIWGLHDGVSWRGNEYPLLYSWNGYKMSKKRAWYAVLQDPSIRAIEY
ncbi:MAG: endo-1,4-beta-xylanase [Lachnospiraceae bacterium]|nr:endo-1,4-beta-xylanase [Lachnospiraceae bacterium]